MAEKAQQELHALFTLLGRTLGFDAPPLPSGTPDPDALMQTGAAIEALAHAQYVPAPQRLELLARMTYAQRSQSATATFSNDEINQLAASVMGEGSNADDRATLIARLGQWAPTTEPLGRSTIDASEPDPELAQLLEKLDLDVTSTAVTYLPQCAASVSTVGGVPALSIVTQAITSKPLAAFESIVDPRRWPQCPLQQDFFREMTELPTPPTPPPFARDTGWKKVIREVVDFSALSPSPTDQTMRTQLEFVYFFPPDPNQPGDHARGGCTYDLYHSEDDKIQVDEGYLLVEDLRPTADKRRYRTLKMVHFRDGDAPAENVCMFWSLAAGMILQGC
jgi:hypothetical protein